MTHARITRTANVKHAYFNNPGGPEIEVFLELGLEWLLVLLGVEVVDVLVEWHPTNTGMLDSDVDLIILLGRGVM